MYGNIIFGWRGDVCINTRTIYVCFFRCWVWVASICCLQAFICISMAFRLIVFDMLRRLRWWRSMFVLFEKLLFWYYKGHLTITWGCFFPSVFSRTWVMYGNIIFGWRGGVCINTRTIYAWVLWSFRWNSPMGVFFAELVLHNGAISWSLLMFSGHCSFWYARSRACQWITCILHWRVALDFRTKIFFAVS